MDATPTSIGITRLGQVAINVHDLVRATAFYRDALGLPLLFTAGGMAFFGCGEIRLVLSRAEKPQFDHPSSILYFSVPDIAAAHRRLSDMGVRFEAAPHLVAPMSAYDLWMGFFHDSENNIMALMSEVPRSASSRIE
jgi:methylmalonyl-CoA/ethylmalonyl-CoA epimerase